MYLSLYRKWRPSTFDEMCGQNHITDILKKQCAENRVSHAYLFCGSRGTGKTSTAKILAKAVNCLHPVNGNPCNECEACRSINNGSSTDVLEIDAASNNGVDNIRDLREEVIYPPSVLKKRVYIIDEVHMLSASAFNALLKTLEEPPEYVIFIFATTELNEIPATIISRCMRFDFSRIDEQAVIDRLEYVAKNENILIAPEASELIANLADGSMRDALSLLEACSNGFEGTLKADDVRNVLGIASEDTICDILEAASKGNVADALETVAEIHRSSKDISVFLDDLSVAVRDLLIEKQLLRFGRKGKIRSKRLSSLCNAFTNEQLFHISSVLEDTQNRISRYSVNKRTILELSVIRLCDLSLSDSPRAISARLSVLEKKVSALSAGNFANIKKAETAQDQNENTQTEPKGDKSVSTDKGFPKKAEENIQSEKEFEFIPELMESLSQSPELTAFLEQAEILESDNNLIIKASSFVLQMLSLDGYEDAITEAAASVSGKIYKLKFQEAETKTEEKKSFLDEL